MESKNTTNFEAKTEQKINYPADFGGLSRAALWFEWLKKWPKVKKINVLQNGYKFVCR